MENENILQPINNVQNQPATEERKISNFWIRILALFLDGIFLGIFGFILGFLFSKVFIGLGSWGRLVGLAIALAYFGLLNSCLGGGQTLGQKITRIQVVDRDGKNISIGKSLLRSLILLLPFFLNGFTFPSSLSSSLIWGTVVVIIAGIIVFGIGGGIIYFYIFKYLNHPLSILILCSNHMLRFHRNIRISQNQMLNSTSSLYLYVSELLFRFLP